MNYVTGETIKNLREKKRITQKELADMINVSDKTISKWETQKGLPDISIIEELSRALGVSIAELLTGELKINDNQSGMLIHVDGACGFSLRENKNDVQLHIAALALHGADRI